MSFDDPFFSLPNDSEWNALVGKQGDPNFYAEGYVEAALELATIVLQKKLFAQRDTLVMPILYNARHGIELHLKLFIEHFHAAGILKERHRANHDIASLFSHLNSNVLHDLTYRINLNKLQPFIESLAKIDEDGQELRYFENRDGEQSLKDHALANIAVIALGLNDLRNVLQELKYRTETLCDEHLTGTFTSKLSRWDLVKIATEMPRRCDWNTPEFSVAKKRIQETYGLSNGQFSKALNMLQQHRELNALIGIETELKYLTDEKALLLIEQWKIIHPQREQEDGIRIRSGRDIAEELMKDRSHENDALKFVLDNFTINELADAETIFYLTRDGTYSEFYEDMLARKIDEFKAQTDMTTEIFNLMHKTSFLRMLEKGVRKLGRLTLADKLSKML